MRIVIDLTASRVDLEAADEFSQCSVSLHGTGDLPSVLAAAGLGWLREDGTHVVVDPLALRDLAGSAAGPSWDEDLAAMQARIGSPDADVAGLVARIERDS
ncbi:MAG TPA: hypothetical protein VMU09_07385 [Acidimicrobiales bacterium]|nr:hypothetical protein [Acidimicrobiales bacterium]